MHTLITNITQAIHTLYGVDFTPEISSSPKPDL